MSDYSEAGAVPVDDAAVENPPTEEEVSAEQERRYPEQAATALHGELPSVDQDSSSRTDTAGRPASE